MEIPFSFQRGKKGTYVYRRRVPDDLKAVVGKDWWKVSLKTASPSEARVKATALAAEHDALLNLPAPQRRLRQREALRTDASKNGAERDTSLWKERQAIIDRLALQMLAEAEKRLGVLSADDRAMIEAGGGLEPLWQQTEASAAFNDYLRDKLAQDGPGAVLADPEEKITPAEAYRRREELERDRAELAADAKQLRKRQQALERLDLKAPDTATEDPDNPRINSVVAWRKCVNSRA